MADLFLHNTLSKKKEKFIPSNPDHVRMYTCGPTVYNYAHIGNARPAVISDVLVRLLRNLFPKVTFASNITDIDDKIIKASLEIGISIKAITEKYEKIYNEDMVSIGVLPPDIQPHATDHIKDMIVMIKRNIENEKAYESDGHVLFDITKYSAYGKLSGRDFEDQIAGSRVKVASYKRNPGDFVLWKPSTENQPGWNSPWGFGRPGWHLECSAMSESALGLPFDIHGGGMDLIFPHHENEIAQSCGSHNENLNPAVYCKYWLHNALLNMDGEKMSKSVGNILYIRELLKKHKGETLRMALLSSHYRQPLNWNDKTIDRAQKVLNKLYRTLKNAEEIEVDFKKINEKVPVSLIESLCDDLNTSKALADINEIAKKLSKEKNNDKKTALKESLLAAGKIFGILQNNPDQWLGIHQSSSEVDEDKINYLIEKRNKARKERDFDLADKIRNKLNKIGIEIEDTSEKTIWKIK